MLYQKRLVKRWGIVVALFQLLPIVSWAACTSSTPDLATLSACVAAADRNATITVSAGTATWASPLTLTKGVTLVGPGRDSLVVTGGTNMLTISPDATAIANEEKIKVTGFTFDGQNSVNTMITMQGAGPSSSKPYRYVIFGDNRVQNSGTGTSGAIVIVGQTRGVIYNNQFVNLAVPFQPRANDSDVEWQNGNFPLSYGTADNLYFEDNTFTYTRSSSSDPGWTIAQQGGRFVYRYNTWNYANSGGNGEIWDIHGCQNYPNGQTGNMVAEAYGNTLLNLTGGYGRVNHRGSWGLYFNNVAPGGGNFFFEANQYSSGCDAATGDRGCQITNTYTFNNTSNGSATGMSLGAQQGCGVAENRDFYNENASCTASSCTSGIGRGTSAPTGTCTTGVGYWVASTTTPTTSSSVIQSGTFYKCTSTNTWTAYYRPYVYPHPLRSGSAPVPLAAPQNLRVVSN